jgi:hypothetical protein
MVSTDGYGGADVFVVAGDYYSDGNLAIVGAVGGVEGASAFVETDFSAKVAAEGGFKGGDVEVGCSRWLHRAQNIFEDVGGGCKCWFKRRGRGDFRGNTRSFDYAAPWARLRSG